MEKDSWKRWMAKNSTYKSKQIFKISSEFLRQKNLSTCQELNYIDVKIKESPTNHKTNVFISNLMDEIKQIIPATFILKVKNEVKVEDHAIADLYIYTEVIKKISASIEEKLKNCIS